MIAKAPMHHQTLSGPSQRPPGPTHESGTAAMRTASCSQRFRLPATALQSARTARPSQNQPWSSQAQQWAEKNIRDIVRPAGALWQPNQLLPDPSSPAFFHQIQKLQQEAAGLPRDLLVVLVGCYVCESLLCNRLQLLNSGPGWLRDDTGAEQHAWARWHRGRTAEVNRHRVLLQRYLDLCGQVDVAAVEKCVQQSIGRGWDPGLLDISSGSSSGSSSSRGTNSSTSSSSGSSGAAALFLIHETIQECIARLMYANLVRLAAYHGADRLAGICGAISDDKAHHARYFEEAAGLMFQSHPAAAVAALTQLLQSGVCLPCQCMEDGWHAAANASVSSSSSSRRMSSSSSSREGMGSSSGGSSSGSSHSSLTSSSSWMSEAEAQLKGEDEGKDRSVKQGDATGGRTAAGVGGGGVGTISSNSSSSSTVVAVKKKRGRPSKRSSSSSSGQPIEPTSPTQISTSSIKHDVQKGSSSSAIIISGSSSHNSSKESVHISSSSSSSAGSVTGSTISNQMEPSDSSSSSGSSSRLKSSRRSSSSSPLYVDFLAVADGVGVYTPHDYAAILDYLIEAWEVPHLRLSGGAAAADQQLLLHWCEGVQRLAELQLERRLLQKRVGRLPPISFSWVGKHEVPL